MSMKKDNGVEFVECDGCGRTFDPENSYEITEWESHDCENFGNCDTCDELYELASREGRCGDCGECAEHCDHDTNATDGLEKN